MVRFNAIAEKPVDPIKTEAAIQARVRFALIDLNLAKFSLVTSRAIADVGSNSIGAGSVVEAFNPLAIIRIDGAGESLVPHRTFAEETIFNWHAGRPIFTG